jgi:hypothetical protein
MKVKVVVDKNGNVVSWMKLERIMTPEGEELIGDIVAESDQMIMELEVENAEGQELANEVERKVKSSVNI